LLDAVIECHNRRMMTRPLSQFNEGGTTGASRKRVSPISRISTGISQPARRDRCCMLS
jgi:hypothetical protein